MWLEREIRVGRAADGAERLKREKENGSRCGMERVTEVPFKRERESECVRKSLRERKRERRIKHEQETQKAETGQRWYWFSLRVLVWMCVSGKKKKKRGRDGGLGT